MRKKIENDKATANLHSIDFFLFLTVFSSEEKNIRFNII